MAGKLMLHCGGEQTTLEKLGRIDIPEATKSYCPIPHQDLVRLTDDRIRKEFPGVDLEWEHGTNKEGAQYFGVATLQIDNDDMGMSIALRNSYDKSLSAGFAAGASVFCCDNLALSGSSFVKMRKHTTNAWRDMKSMVLTAMVDAEEHYLGMKTSMLGMKEVDLETIRGYEVIGRALGTGVLTTTQTNVAIREWDEPSHEEFAPRNLYSLYNAFTEAGKRGRVGQFVDRYAGIHDFFAPEGVVIEAEIIATA